MIDDTLWMDIESTGLCLYRDRIVELGLLFRGKSRTFRFNPQVKISEGASRVHKIFDRDVAQSPKFSDHAESLYSLFQGCESIGGYNIRKFDMVMLQMEFLRCDPKFVLPHKPIIDVYEMVQGLFKSHKLKDIYLVLSNKVLTNAHSASSDILATKELWDIINQKFLSTK